MNGIGRYICIAFLEIDVHNYQVVDMVKMVSDLVCGDLSCNTSHDKVSCSSVSDLVRHMRWNVELSVVPAKLELTWLAVQTTIGHACLTRFMWR